jgi:riboflavin kinase / FMN adenylyltransferase
MKLLHGFESPTLYRGGFVSIGNFDGVHRGHQAMIAALVRHARSAGVPAVVLTFEPHPITLLRPEQSPPQLNTPERKAELLGRCGVDCTIAYPTDWDLLNLSPQEFFDRIVLGELQARGLVEGPNFFFGHGRAGDIHTLEQLCRQAGLVLEIVPPVTIEGQMVSSSVVRSLISGGRIAEAVALLGHPYRVRGTVVSGAERGRQLGFPTANLDGIHTLLPPDGVYAGVAHHAGRRYPAAVSLGPNTTFGEDARKLEVYLIGFSGDLYGHELDLDFIERLRDMRSFANIEELRQQLEQDVEQTRQLVNSRNSMNDDQSDAR